MAEKTPAPAKKAVRKKVTPGEPKIAAASPKPETAQPAKPETAGPETRNTKPETTKPETVPAAPPEKKKSETDEFVDYIGAPLDSWWKFIRADYREYYLRLLKLHLVRVLLQFAIIAIFAAIGIGILIGGSTLQVPGGLLGAIIVLVIAVIIGALLSMWVLQSFENAAYVLTDAQLNRKPYRMLDALGAVKGKTLRFVIVDSILQFVILLPAMLILLLPFAGLFTGSSAATLLFMMGFWLAYLFFLLYYFATNILYTFLIQFWRYGFLLEGRGVIDSLKRSLGLIRSHIFEVLVFDFVLVVLAFVASIPLMMFSVFMYFVLLFVQIALMFIFPFGFLVYLLLVFISALAAVFLSSIVEMVWRPMHLLFWRKVAEEKKK